MIKGITGGAGVYASGGTVSYPYIPQNNNNPIQGMLRIWGQDMQVFDGSSWVTLASSHAQVELDGNTQSILRWAEAQRAISMKRMEAVEKHPALTKALEAIARAEANFDILAKFVEHDLPDATTPNTP